MAPESKSYTSYTSSTRFDKPKHPSLNDNIFNNTRFKDTAGIHKYFMDKINYRYQHIDQLVNFLIYSRRFASFRTRIFLKYLEHTMKKPMNPMKEGRETKINQQIVTYALICMIAGTYEYNNPSWNCEIVNNFFDSIIADKLFESQELVNLLIKHSRYPNVEIEKYLAKIRLDESHLDLLIEYYKGGDVKILEHFLNWNIIPTNDHMKKLLICNTNNHGFKLSTDFKVDYKFIKNCIACGKYPIPNLDKKTKVKLTNKEKKDLCPLLFRGNFNKPHVKSIKKQFDLKFDLKCMKTLCSFTSSLSLYNYLIDEGIKPDLKCMANFIPKFCSHAKVRTILNKAMDNG
jgi:hypothetical protein